MRRKSTLNVLLVSLLLAACAQAADEPQGTDWAAQFEDAEVGRIYANMMEAMAPNNGWERARYIQWDWVVNRGETPRPRSHRWDRYEGTYRYEADGQNGKVVAIFNVDNAEAGQAWVDGVLQEGEEAQNLLTRAYRSFINDSYWLLMPYKWADDGVNARYVGAQTDEMGRNWEVVELTFEEVGLTPQNKYHGFVNPETWRMEQWSHWSQAETPEPNFTLGWTDWQQYGPIMLSSGRPNAEGVSGIYMDNLMVSESLPDGAFDPPTGG